MLAGPHITNDANAMDSRPGAGGPLGIRQHLNQAWNQVMGPQPAWAKANPYGGNSPTLGPPPTTLSAPQGPSFSPTGGGNGGPTLGPPVTSTVQAGPGPVNFGIASPTEQQHRIPALINALRGMR